MTDHAAFPRQRLRFICDRLATALISACGIGVIGAVLAIGVFLAVEVAPLFVAPEVREQATAGDSLPALASLPTDSLSAAGEQQQWQADGRELVVFQRTASGLELAGRVEAVPPSRRITALAALQGGRALLIGDDGGGVQRWVTLADQDLPVPAGRYQALGSAPIRQLIALPDRQALAVNEANQMGLYQAIGGLRWQGQAPSGEALGWDDQGGLWWGSPDAASRLEIDAEHAEVNWRSLWLPQHYEGYAAPQQRWQTSASDSRDEPRYGLAPLAWGTLKAAAYALLVAIPLALGAAVHTACFMSAGLRTRIKPTLELMEALPGVVLGFIAGLVLAPWVERYLPGVLALLLVLPLGMLSGGALWACCSARWRQRLPLSWAGLWLMPWLALLAALALWLSPSLERLWFDGDMRSWLALQLGLDYASRNAMIVGLAMGLAVMPTIYALAEDALSGVPKSLAEGAAAMGATRWQALWKVVLPAASPGIFAALMIGAGRAVGETMIVLMATGNTAVMTASPFEGLRSLSANIAIELPEAALGGTHYRLLFLSALLLFVFTFCVNTLAEVVRGRLRRRYQRLGGPT